MSDPFSGTGLAGLALTGASVYGLLTGTDYGVVFGAFAGAVFYIATAADLSVLRRLAYFFVSYIVGILCSGLLGSKLTSSDGVHREASGCYRCRNSFCVSGSNPYVPEQAGHWLAGGADNAPGRFGWY